MRFQLLLAAGAYVGTLHVSYVYLVTPYYAYSGLDYAPVSMTLLIWSWFIVLLPALWLPLRSTRPSAVVYYFVYAFVLVPGCIVPAYTDALPTKGLISLQVALITCFALLGLVYAIPPGGVPRIHLSYSCLFAAVGLFSVTSYLTIIHFFGFHFRFPDPMHVYPVRQDFADASEIVKSRWAAYCIDWQALAINPFLMAFGVISKRYYLICIGFVGELIIYALGGLKQALFALGLLIFLYFAMRFRHFGLAFLSGLTIFVAACFLCDRFLLHTGTGLTSLFVRRVAFLDGQLTGMYFDFFSNNPHALLSQSTLQGFVKTVYLAPLPKVIGAAYFGSENADANANFLADGFANFGYFGMFGATAILAAVLWAVDTLARGRNRLLVVMMLGVPAFEFANSAVLTCLGNHGVGLVLVLLCFLPLEPATSVAETGHPHARAQNALHVVRRNSIAQVKQ
jgi:hypothetical protein